MTNTQPSLPIIDTHQHLWNLTTQNIPWLAGGGPLSRNFMLAEYERDAHGLNITQTVYMEVDVDPSGRIREAQDVLALCNDPHTHLAGAVIGCNPLYPNLERYVQHFGGAPHLKGLRRVLHGDQERGTCLEPQFVANMQMLGTHDLIFDLCMRPNELEDAAQLARQCPDTRFVLDHCGNPDIHADPASPEHQDWQRGIGELARLPNVVCKISGIVAQVRPGEQPDLLLAPFVRECARTFGPDRIMFASDWPVCTLGASLRGWAEALQTITTDWSQADRRKLFHDNAQQFYKLE